MTLEEQIANLPNTPLSDEEIGLSGESWTEPSEFPPPIQPGIYECYISEIHGIWHNDGSKTKSGKPFISTSQDFWVKNGNAMDRLAVRRAFISSMVRANGHSDLGDEFNSAGIDTPRTFFGQGETLRDMMDRKEGIFLDVDWDGFCSGCYNKALTELTGCASPEEARDYLKSRDDRNKVYRDAEAKGLKLRSARQFPDTFDGEKADRTICTDCGGDVKARTKLRRFVGGA